jgi:hypothetical protein
MNLTSIKASVRSSRLTASTPRIALALAAKVCVRAPFRRLCGATLPTAAERIGRCTCLRRAMSRGSLGAVCSADRATCRSSDCSSIASSNWSFSRSAKAGNPRQGSGAREHQSRIARRLFSPLIDRAAGDPRDIGPRLSRGSRRRWVSHSLTRCAPAL